MGSDALAYRYLKTELRYIPPIELHDYWDLVRPGLERIKIKAKELWIPEDVYNALKTGLSTLHLTEVDDEYAGFIVLTPIIGFDARELSIWCCYNASSHDVMSLFSDELVQMARNIQARRITFQSNRRWDRHVEKHGFEPRQMIYAKEI